jgi:hypothetical protein
VGYDADSTHAHRIYWQDRSRVSVKRNIRFTSNTVTVHVPFHPTSTSTSTSTSNPKPSTPTQQMAVQTPASSSMSVTQQAAQQSASQPQTAPASSATTSSTNAPITAAPPAPPFATDSGEEEMPEDEDEVEQQLATPAPASATPAPASQGTRKSPCQLKPSQKLRDMQAALLAGDEEDFVFHVQHDSLIASAIQDIDSDPKTVIEARTCIRKTTLC